ncbi:MAG: hypothetical protein AAF985_08150, partial [Bacteroidota bacterium]
MKSVTFSTVKLWIALSCLPFSNSISAQVCQAYAGVDTTICGFSYLLEGQTSNGTWDIICELSTDIASLTSVGPGVATATVSTCGYYNFVYTVMDNSCIDRDTIEVLFRDPSTSTYTINSTIDIEYNDFDCPSGNPLGCDNTNIVGIEGSTPPDLVWNFCSNSTCQSILYQSISSGNINGCIADDIFIDISSSSGSSADCSSAAQNEVVNDFLSYLDGNLGAALGDIIGQCPFPTGNCPEPTPSSPDCLYNVIDTQYYYIPVREGGQWTYLQDDTTSILLNDSTIILNDTTNYLLIVEPGADHFGPDSLFFELFRIDENGDTTDLNDFVSLEVQWIEHIRYDTIVAIDTIVLDSCAIPCGGVSINVGFDGVPPAPPFDCGPLTLNFGPPDVCAYANVYVDVFASGNIDCNNSCVELYAFGESNCGPVSYSWGSSSMVVCSPGFYIVSVIDENGCTATAGISVDECLFEPYIDIPPVPDLTCLEPCQTIDANFTSDISYVDWQGPNGFYSNEFNPAVCSPGIYTAFAVNFCGCESIASIEVNEDIEIPIADAGPDQTISCIDPCVMLQGSGSSSGPLITYQWQGPNALTAFDSSPTVCEAGTYTLLVTNTNNGCTATDEVIVEENVINFSNSIEATICPNECYDLGNESFCSEGLFTVVLTSSQGCNSIVTLALEVNNPDLLLSASSTLITCTTPSVVLDALSTSFATDAVVEWYLGANFIGNSQSIVATQGGNYNCVLSSGACSVSQTITIQENFETPIVDAGGNVQIDCNNACVTLNATAAIGSGSLDFQWTGPNGFSSNLLTPQVCQPGNYSLVVTSQNGCTASAETNVSQTMAIPPTQINQSICLGDCFSIGSQTFCDQGNYDVLLNSVDGCDSLIQLTLDVLPTNISIANTSVLNCNNTTVTIDASASTSGNNVTYQWTGNGIVGIANGPSIVVNQGGLFTLTLSNGSCSNSQTIEVVQDFETPVVDAGGSLQIDCNNACVTLGATAAISSGSLNYQWSGNGIIGNANGPVVQV